MKKTLIALILCFSLAMISCAAADPELFDHYSIYGLSENTHGLFDGEQFSFDVFINASELKAYFVETIWKDGKAMTRNHTADIKSRSGNLYFLFENGAAVKYRYDDTRANIWIDFSAGSLRVHGDAGWYVEYFDYMDSIL